MGSAALIGRYFRLILALSVLTIAGAAVGVREARVAGRDAIRGTFAAITGEVGTAWFHPFAGVALGVTAIIRGVCLTGVEGGNDRRGEGKFASTANHLASGV